jgi:hypothetical protein
MNGAGLVPAENGYIRDPPTDGAQVGSVCVAKWKGRAPV